ncbi:MAG: hypothetical protein KKH12_03255 [Gammaproteobacteria bacterium]|nr:hypothetical protein [Gammaproteobacteria bacterium]MBU1480673.1 hypothetical protein [Gammaproteobacteria bacterium]
MKSSFYIGLALVLQLAAYGGGGSGGGSSDTVAPTASTSLSANNVPTSDVAAIEIQFSESMDTQLEKIINGLPVEVK